MLPTIRYGHWQTASLTTTYTLNGMETIGGGDIGQNGATVAYLRRTRLQAPTVRL